jgi:hypothetical protein
LRTRVGGVDTFAFMIGEEESDERGQTAEGGGQRYTAMLPAHCVNVFLPLVVRTMWPNSSWCRCIVA